MAKVKAAGNVVPTYNSNALTAYCNTASLASALATIDVTDFASTAMEYINGFATWTVPLGGHWDPALDAFLAPDAVTPGTKRTFVIAFDDGTTTVSYTWTTNAEIQNYTVDASSPTDGITWSCEFLLSGAPTRAVT